MKVELFLRDGGAETPCKRCFGSEIYNMLMVPFFEVCVALGVSLNDLAVERYAEKMMPEQFSQWDEKEREAALMVAAFHSVHRDWWR